MDTTWLFFFHANHLLLFVFKHSSFYSFWLATPCCSCVDFNMSRFILLVLVILLIPLVLSSLFLSCPIVCCVEWPSYMIHMFFLGFCCFHTQLLLFNSLSFTYSMCVLIANIVSIVTFGLLQLTMSLWHMLKTNFPLSSYCVTSYVVFV